MRLSREAYGRLVVLEKQLDPELRKNIIDPLLDKERQIEAIRSRAARGGTLRTSDQGNLQALLKRRVSEYEALCYEFPWNSLSPQSKALVERYISERREHLTLGDSERVRAAYLESTSDAVTAIAC